MLGYEVTLSDGSRRQVEATSYEVSDNGVLLIEVDDQVVATFNPGEWVSVTDMGQQLTDLWPHPEMEALLNRLYWLLAVKYGHTVRGGLGRPEEYASGLMNELGTFVGGVLERVGIAPDSRDYRDLIDEVETIVASEFDVRRRLRSHRRPR